MTVGQTAIHRVSGRTVIIIAIDDGPGGGKQIIYQNADKTNRGWVPAYDFDMLFRIGF